MSNNISSLMDKLLPPDLNRLLRDAGSLGEQLRQNVYLVGGVVRDLFLARPNLDLDLVVEGDVAQLATRLEAAHSGKTVVHSRFGTARVSWAGMSVDLAAARSETYARPGALPAVTRGQIESDLARRDFTINAMAVRLSPGRYGDVLDLLGGTRDLERRYIRVLHDKSFIDDPTRIWRAIRYEQRLGFQIEPLTLGLLEKGLPMLGVVTGDRIRHELERVLSEESPEKALYRAGDLGILARVHPALKADSWLVHKFSEARAHCQPEPLEPQEYLALLVYRLTAGQIDELASYLHMPASTYRILHDIASAKGILNLLADTTLKPSRIVSVLDGYSPAALAATMIAVDVPPVRRQIDLYLSTLRYVKSVLTGDDLKNIGLHEGPRVGAILGRLREARLDGVVSSRQDEIDLVKRLLAG